MPYSAAHKARILIVDDHPMVRAGITMLINGETEMHACCEAGTITQALQANRTCPHDMAIIDMSLAGESGLSLIKCLLSDSPNLPILVLSMHDESVYAESVLRAGARGYLMKQAATNTMLRAIRQVLQGELYVSEQMLSRLLQKTARAETAESPISSLSASEITVLHLIGQGLATKEIAEKLNRNVKTIESHKTNMRHKLNLSSSNQLTYFAITLLQQSEQE